MAVINPPGYLHNVTSHTAQTDRLSSAGGLLLPDAVGSLRPAGGVRLPSDMVVTYSSGTTISVSAGLAYVPQGQSNLGGAYAVANDGALSIVLGARHATLSRNDLICVRVQDSFYTGAINTADIFVVAGTAASTPVDPALPAGASYLVLARVVVPPGATALTVTRLCKVAALWGGIQDVDATDTTPGLTTGQYRDHPTLGLQRWNGTTWKPAGIAGASYQSTAGSVVTGAAATNPKIWVGKADMVFGGVSYAVTSVDYSAAGFSEVPTVVPAFALENTYAVYGGSDQLTTTGCITVFRSGVNIPGTLALALHIIAIGR